MDPRFGSVPPLVAILFFVGCASSRSDATLPSEPEARELAISASLALRDPQMGVERGDVFLDVTLANPGTSRVSGRCAPEWYDAKGQVVAAPLAWLPFDLAEGRETRLRFPHAPANAKSWRLRFAP